MTAPRSMAEALDLLWGEYRREVSRSLGGLSRVQEHMHDVCIPITDSMRRRSCRTIADDRDLPLGDRLAEIDRASGLLYGCYEERANITNAYEAELAHGLRTERYPPALQDLAEAKIQEHRRLENEAWRYYRECKTASANLERAQRRRFQAPPPPLPPVAERSALSVFPPLSDVIAELFRQQQAASAAAAMATALPTPALAPAMPPSQSAAFRAGHPQGRG